MKLVISLAVQDAPELLLKASLKDIGLYDWCWRSGKERLRVLNLFRFHFELRRWSVLRRLL